MTSSKRTIPIKDVEKLAHACDGCKPAFTLATHGVTDSREVTPGVFEETTATRFGCDRHRVVSKVYYLNGDVKLLSEVLACQ